MTSAEWVILIGRGLAVAVGLAALIRMAVVLSKDDTIERNIMHYRNGREAKNGDEIVQLDARGHVQEAGVLIRAVAGNDFCNGIIANDRTKSFVGACLCDCLHVDDLVEILKEKGLDKRPEGK